MTAHSLSVLAACEALRPSVVFAAMLPATFIAMAIAAIYRRVAFMGGVGDKRKQERLFFLLSSILPRVPHANRYFYSFNNVFFLSIHT